MLTTGLVVVAVLLTLILPIYPEGITPAIAVFLGLAGITGGLGLLHRAARRELLVLTPWAIAIGLALQGIARSSLMTVAILTLVETKGVGEERAGTASGLFFSAAEVGGAGGPILLGLVYDATHSFDLSLWILAGVAAFLLLGTMRLKALQS